MTVECELFNRASKLAKKKGLEISGCTYAKFCDGTTCTWIQDSPDEEAVPSTSPLNRFYNKLKKHMSMVGQRQ